VWCSTVVHGLMTECMSYWYPDIDNFWHSQSMIMFWGWREPLHIIMLYPAFMYPVHVAVTRMNISEHIQPFAASLLDCLIDIPFDIIGIKFLWWTWHDTDSNIYERSYWVPWCSYIFHMTFATSFTFVMLYSRRYFTGLSGTYSEAEIEAMPFTRKQKARAFWGDFASLLVTGALGFPVGVLIFTPFYHFPHDVFHVSSEACACVYATLCLIIVIYGIMHRTPHDLKERGEREIHRAHKRKGRGHWHIDEVYLIVVAHFGFYLMVVTFADPSIIRAVGVRQEIGTMNHPTFNCNKTSSLTYPYSLSMWTQHLHQYYPETELRKSPFKSKILPNGDLKIWKSPYLCIASQEDDLLFEEPYFDFNCLAQLPEAGEWYYTICGNSYGSHSSFTEYWFVVTSVCLLGLGVYTQILCFPRTCFEVWGRHLAGSPPLIYKEEVDYKHIGQLQSVGGMRSQGQDGQEYEVLRSGEEVWHWESRHEVETDGCGPTYAEMGGLYGHDGTGSSRERIARYRHEIYARDRLEMFSKRAL